MQFTRNQRMREKGALDVPMSCVAESFKFDLIDCVCDVQYDAALFATFERVRCMLDGRLVDGYAIPHRVMRQVEYRPYQMVW